MLNSHVDQSQTRWPGTTFKLWPPIKTYMKGNQNPLENVVVNVSTSYKITSFVFADYYIFRTSELHNLILKIQNGAHQNLYNEHSRDIDIPSLRDNEQAYYVNANVGLNLRNFSVRTQKPRQGDQSPSLYQVSPQWCHTLNTDTYSYQTKENRHFQLDSICLIQWGLNYCDAGSCFRGSYNNDFKFETSKKHIDLNEK